MSECKYVTQYGRIMNFYYYWNSRIIAQQHAEDLFELYLKIQNAEKDSVIDIRKEASADHEEVFVC